MAELREYLERVWRENPDLWDKLRDAAHDFPPDDPPDLREPVEWWNGAEGGESNGGGR